MSGRSARTIRNFSLELSQDLVLLDIRKSTFQHLTINWNLNVLEMALKTLHFVQGLSRTPLVFFSSISHHQNFQNYFAKTKNLENRKSENLQIQKPRFTNKCPASGKPGWGKTSKHRKNVYVHSICIHSPYLLAIFFIKRLMCWVSAKFVENRNRF